MQTPLLRRDRSVAFRVKGLGMVWGLGFRLSIQGFGYLGFGMMGLGLSKALLSSQFRILAGL